MLLVPNSNGFKDFCVKSLKAAAVGRKEIKIAEQGTMHVHVYYQPSLLLILQARQFLYVGGSAFVWVCSSHWYAQAGRRWFPIYYK